MGPGLTNRIAVHLITPLAVGALMFSGGCESTPDGTTGRSLLNASAAPSTEVASPFDTEVEAQRSQAQRDVDAYLQRQEQIAGRPVFSDEAAASPPATPAPNAPRRVVIFNDSPRQDAARDETIRLPSLKGDAVSVSPLFSDRPETPSVEAFPDGDATTLAPDRMSRLLVDLRRELYMEGARSDQPLKQLLPIAAMALIDPGAVIDPNAVPDLTETEREMLRALQEFFGSLATRLDDGVDVEEAIAEGVSTLREAVIHEPELLLPTLALCYAVEGFGRYQSFDRNSFLAQSGQRMIVYVEVEEFTSETNAKGEWVTELSQQVTIYSDRDGIPVWRSGDLQSAVDVAKNQRRDFFLLQIITLPPALSVGKYHLKVRVRDEKSGAEAEKAIEFEMVADPKMAARMP